MKYRIHHFREMKQKGEKFAMLTAYDYLTAKIVDEVGIPLILVGDSLGNVMLGYETTIPVTMRICCTILKPSCAESRMLWLWVICLS